MISRRVYAGWRWLEQVVQRPFLQGVGQALFSYPIAPDWTPPVKLECFPHAHQEGLLEGWGMALGEDERFSPYPWQGQESLSWMAATKGFSARSLASVQQGKAQFEALFEGPAPRSLAPPLRQ